MSEGKIQVVCPGCGARPKPVPESYRGRKARCPKCSTVFFVQETPELITPGPGLSRPYAARKAPVRTSEPDDVATRHTTAPQAEDDPEATRVAEPTAAGADYEPTQRAGSAPAQPDPDATRMAETADPDATRVGGALLPGADPDATRVTPSSSPMGDPDATRMAGDSAAPQHDRPGIADSIIAQPVMSQDESGRDVPLCWNPGELILDTYRVDSVLGQGAFGTVYKVKHLDWDMELAVKTPNPEALDAHNAEIFVSEADTWSRLGLHLNIVSCYYVRTLGGAPRVFAEFVDGGSLQELIEREQIDLSTKLDIAIQFAWGLAYAHGQGLVHQDIKPANVMLTADGRAKVTDFGLAKAKGGVMGQGQAHMQGGQTVLVDGGGFTPAYASPEQLSGGQVSRAADVWAFGVSLLAMYTGGARWRVGVAAPSVLDTMLEEAGGAIVGMPDALVALLRECFVIEPNKRLRDMNEAARLLVAIYEQATGTAYPRREPRPDQASSADSLVNRALSHLDLGDSAQAMVLFDEALSLQPHHPEATYNRGLLRWRAGEIADLDLVKELEEVRSTHSQSWTDELALGFVHMERGDYESAIAVLESIGEDGRDNPQVVEALEKSRTLLPSTKGEWLKLGDKVAHAMWPFAFDAALRRVAIPFLEHPQVDIHDMATGALLHALSWREGMAYSVAMSRDGTLVAAGSTDQVIRLWSVENGECLREFHGHQMPTHSMHYGGRIMVAMTADGTRIYSGGEDKIIREWDVATGQCLRVFDDAGFIPRMVLSPDESQLATVDFRGQIHIWNLESGQKRDISHQEPEGLHTVCFSPDGHYLFVGSGKGLLYLYDARTGHLRYVRNAHPSMLLCMAPAVDGRFLVTGGNVSMLRLWEVATGRCLRSYEKTASGSRITREVEGVAIAVDSGVHVHELSRMGKTISSYTWLYEPTPAPWMLCKVSGSEQVGAAQQQYEEAVGKARRAYDAGEYNTALGHLREARSQPGFDREAAGLELSRQLAMRLPRVGLAGAWQTGAIEVHERGIDGLAVNPDGSFFMTAATTISSQKYGHPLKMWDSKTGLCIREFKGSNNVREIAISRDGKRMATTTVLGPVKVWDLETGAVLQTMDEEASQSIYHMAFSPDGRFVYGAKNNPKEKKYVVHMWDAETGVSIRTFDKHTEGVQALALSHDGTKLLTYAVRENLLLWDVAQGEVERSYDVVPFQATHLCFAPGGRKVCFINHSSLCLFDLDAGELEKQTGNLALFFPRLAMTTDGRFALAAADTIKMLDVQAMEPLRTFEGHHTRVMSLAVSDDGRYFVSGDMKGTVRIWALDWELEPREQADWDDAALPYLQDFLRSRTMSLVNILVRDDISSDDRKRLQDTRNPEWSDEEFSRLLHTLQSAGLGWIRPEGIRARLDELAAGL